MLLMFVENHACDIVIDTAASHAPVGREHQRSGWQVGLAARLNNKFFRVAGSKVKRSMTEDERACTFLVVNQFEKIGVC
jgi:hypothetical protein